jgi:uncharacterized Zn ribbon protein
MKKEGKHKPVESIFQLHMNKMIVCPQKSNICNSAFLDIVTRLATNKDETNSVPRNIKDSHIPEVTDADLIKIIKSMKNKKSGRQLA